MTIGTKELRALNEAKEQLRIALLDVTRTLERAAEKYDGLWDEVRHDVNQANATLVETEES